MPEIHIVRIDEIAECVDRTLTGIRDGLLLARRNGIIARWPEKVDFQMTVVKDWQVLDMSSVEESSTKETQGGTTSEVSTTGIDGQENSNDASKKQEGVVHNERGQSDTTTSE